MSQKIEQFAKQIAQTPQELQLQMELDEWKMKYHNLRNQCQNLIFSASDEGCEDCYVVDRIELRKLNKLVGNNIL
jgi:hypothetical protein